MIVQADIEGSVTIALPIRAKWNPSFGLVHRGSIVFTSLSSGQFPRPSMND